MFAGTVVAVIEANRAPAAHLMPPDPGAHRGLVLSSLVKSYGTKRVLNGVDLQVAPGEIVGLLGPNGVGKSTTLRAAAALTGLDGGQVLVDGVDPARQPLAARAAVGYLPDVGGLFPRLTVMEHLELAARLRQVHNWEPAALELLRQVDLLDDADLPAGRASHGMSRRLGIAIAMLAAPPVVLLDEPFDGVDPLASRAVRALLRRAAEAGATVLCSTHLLDVAARTCNRLAVVAAGRVVAVGTPADLAASTGAGDLEEAYAVLMGAGGARR